MHLFYCTEAIHVVQKQSLELPDGSYVYTSFYGHPCDSTRISDEEIL